MENLLISYGADPLTEDSGGVRPYDLREEGGAQPKKHAAPRHPCRDPEPPNCLHLAAMGRCFSDNSTSLDRIWSTCPAACGVCPKPASPSLYRNNNGALADHHDMDLDCEARAARGHCWHEDYRKTMHQHCTRACVKHETWQGCMRSQIMLNKLHSRKPGTRYSPDIPCERAAECRAQCFAQMIIADANKATSRLEAIPWKDLVGEDDAGSQQALEPNDVLLPKNPGACISKAHPVGDRSSIVPGAVQADFVDDRDGWALVRRQHFLCLEMLEHLGDSARRAEDQKS